MPPSEVDVDSWKNPGCSTWSVRRVDAIGSVVVSNNWSSVMSSAVPFSSSSATAVVVGNTPTSSAAGSVTLNGRAVDVAAAVMDVVVGGAVDVAVAVTVALALLVTADALAVGAGGGGCESYRFNDDSSRRRFQAPPSMSLVSMSARNTDMCRCSPYMRFIKP